MKRLGQIVTIILILVSQQLIGCKPRSARAKIVMVHGEGFTGIIFPAEKKLYGFGFAPEAQSWTPTEEDVRLAEKELPSFLRTSAAQSPEALVIVEHLSSYKRQYAGMVVNGQKEVFVNSFCNAFNTDWATDPVVVEDGGHCYFQVLFSMEKKSFHNLQINGRA